MKLLKAHCRGVSFFCIPVHKVVINVLMGQMGLKCLAQQIQNFHDVPLFVERGFLVLHLDLLNALHPVRSRFVHWMS